jgi:hypothetical protein
VKGIRSPWAKPPPVEVDPLAGAKPGLQPVRFAGRLYSIVIELPLRIDETRARQLAFSILGEALDALTSLGPELHEELTRQKLALGERPLGPCVELPLGARPLFGVASSTDEATALAMVVDRLALTFNHLNNRRATTRDTLGAHHITVMRNA